jgi:hypothetical protein
VRFWLLVLVGCAFRPGAPTSLAGSGDAAGADAPLLDVAADAAPPFCEADPHLVMCFSFDQNPLPAMLANEGTAAVSAQVMNTTSIASPLGRAALLDATSEIYVAMGSGVTGVLSAEIWFRFDVVPANNGDRMGLYDSNVVPPNISLFFYRADPIYTLRCGMGGETEVWNAPQLQPGTWVHAACICDGTNLHMVVDGTDLGPIAGSCASGGAFVADGFTIGSNNNGGATGADAQLVGAIDGIRLWDETIPF